MTPYKLILRWRTKTEQEIRPDKKWYVPIVNGILCFACKAETKEQAKSRAELYGLENYTIESFWETEYL